MAASKQKYILVAEDDKLYAKVYQNKLTREGYKTVVVNNGEELLKVVKKDIPDLILLDMIMPGMDGFETLKALKADTKISHIPVVVMSNLGQDSDINKAKELGADAYLVKSSVSIMDLTEKIRGLVS